PVDIPEEALVRAGFKDEDLDGSWQPFGPVGCEVCKNTGYKGRVGIYQVMPISEEMERIIMKNGTAIDLADQAQREGVRDLRQSGLIKVKNVKKASTRGGKKITEKDITIFTRQLAVMMKAGVPLLQAFDIVGRGHANPSVGKLLLDIKTEVETGSSLGQAFRKYPLYF